MVAVSQIHVLVLLGGDCPEREVSIRSGRAVIQAAKQAGFIVSEYDPKDGDGGLVAACLQADVVLPVLHGFHGEDGEIQHKLEELGLLYLGTDSEHSTVAFNKKDVHQVIEHAGIPMPRYEIVSSEAGSDLYESQYVLKPIRGGSSIDTLISKDVSVVNEGQQKELLAKYDTMLLEEYIQGLEITVPILGDEALPVIAIIPTVNETFDYENKYNGKTEEICPVPHEVLSKELQDKAQSMALQVHQVLGARHLSRVDMIVRPTGEICVLELNTIPGLTDQSLMPKSAQAAGMDMPTFVTRLVELALE